ncbi:ethylbenzene dehydrogenase-related protein [Halobacteria archaeon AArc-curdl1]|uniref:Ethylbenzene dehydrogenase-related protein n=1 Tax=Natronosalvus hydrolyticus TaxID=2979988 RepID=A0AAP3E5W8_9EURY|nr:ethylbenzene dehydrogenase-related protein [Halobacteria archaeon AArc-curdl1]
MTEEPRGRSDDEVANLSIDEARDALKGEAAIPKRASGTLRRRFLMAMGATATIGASAGCLGLFSEDPEAAGSEDDDIDYSEIENFKLDWVPKQILKNLNFQVAYDDDELYFRFNWEQPIKNGWFHDLFVYEDGEWTRYGNVNPEIANEEREDHTGFTEDRLSFLLNDGSVEGFENYGGWITVHEGTRHLPGAPTAEEVEDHPHHGDLLGNDDVRKYIPQSRTGEWWENPWDDVKDQEELDRMLEDGEFVDLVMARCARGVPGGYGTVHCILDHRHGAMDEPSERIRDSQSLDEDGQPQYMFDPDMVENGALELEEIYDGNVLQTDTHTLIHRDEDRDEDAHPPDATDTTAAFDPDIAEFEGAVIPRRMVFPDRVEGPGALWKIDGRWEDDEWTIEMWRDLQSGYLGETEFEAGGVYTFSPALHHGAGSRWHWVAYPYKLGLGEGTDADFQAVRISGDEPDWDDIPTYTIPLIYPGQVDWTWLTSKEHRGYIPTRNDEMSIWDVHDNPRRMAAMVLGMEIGEDPRR